jgi:mRNA interferase RelE/StbE
MYNIVMRKQAEKKLDRLTAKDAFKISEAIKYLGLNPDDPRLKTRKLGGREGYRMTVDNWRVIYLRDDKIRIISIEKIGPRGDVYK